MQVICKNKLLMEIDICFHNLKQRFNSSEGFYYSSYTKTSFWFLWPTSDALLQSTKSRILPALSWMHHVCSASQSRCSKHRNSTLPCSVWGGVSSQETLPKWRVHPNHCTDKSLDLCLLCDFFTLADWFLICHYV